MTSISIPESVQAYFDDKHVQTAVDSLLEKAKANLIELAVLKSGANLNSALFLARQTQFEYVKFLYDIAEELLKDPSEFHKKFELEPGFCTPQDVWDEGALGFRSYEKPNRFELYLCLEPENDLGVHLRCFMYAGDEAKLPFENLENWEEIKGKNVWLDPHYKSKNTPSWEALTSGDVDIESLKKCVNEVWESYSG